MPGADEKQAVSGVSAIAEEGHGGAEVLIQSWPHRSARGDFWNIFDKIHSGVLESKAQEKDQ